MPPIIHNLPFNDVETDALYLRRDADSGPDKDLAYNLGSPAARWNAIYAVTFQGTAVSALYADVAERFDCDFVVGEGSLVSVGGTKEITITSKSCDIDVLGVVSYKPAIGLNSKAGTDETHPYIALSGRIPCLIKGKLEKGQRIISSNEAGVAVGVSDSALNSISPFCVIGRALEIKETMGIELSMIVVGVK